MGNTQKVTGNTSGGDAPSPGVPSLYDQWRAHQKAQPNAGTEPTPVRLPSGMQVKARRPNLLFLLRSGRIPDALTPRVNELIKIAENAGEGGVKAEMQREHASDPAEFYTTWTKLLDVVWLEVVDEPRFVDGTPKPGEEALPLYDENGRPLVSDADKTFLFVWAQGVDQTIAEFPDRNARSAAPVGDPPASD